MARRDWTRAWLRVRTRYRRGLRSDVQEELRLMGRNAVLELRAGAVDPLDLLPADAGPRLGQVVVQRLSEIGDDVASASAAAYPAMGPITVDIADILDEAGSRMVGVADELRQAVGRAVADGIQRDLPLADIADALEGHFDQPWRALRVARTEVATVGNRTTARAWSSAGVTEVRISDGAECGWSSHDDSLRADGLTRTIAEFDDMPISHPNCQRAASPQMR